MMMLSFLKHFFKKKNHKTENNWNQSKAMLEKEIPTKLLNFNYKSKVLK